MDLIEVTKQEFELFTGGYYGNFKSKIDTNEDPVIEYFFPASDTQWTGKNHQAKIIYEPAGDKYFINL